MLNLAIIGCGRISGKHIQAAIDNRNDIRLVATCDIQKCNAERRAREYEGKTFCSTKVYTEYVEMLEKEQIDLVSVCTESGYHAEIAIKCMEMGKHIIVEKPMALSTKDAEDMIEVARKNNVKLCVSHQNRFNPPIQKLRQALESGRFGKIIAGNARILWNRDITYYKQAPWRGTYELDGGCLMNQCIHNIDLLQWMLGGQVKWVHGEVDNFNHGYIEAEDYGTIQMRFENGAIGNVEGTVCTFPKNLEETLSIIGEKATVVIGGLAVNKIETWNFEDNLDSELDIIRECNQEVDSVYGNGHTPLYKDMIFAIKEDREPYVNGQSGKIAMEIILSAYKSSAEGRRISFPIGEIQATDFKKVK